MTAALQRYSFRVLIWAIYVFLLAPLVCVLVVSFNAEPVQSFPPTSWSLKWYAFAFSSETFMHAAMVSIVLATTATIIATPLGVLAAIGLWRGNWRGKAALEAIFVAPIIVPGLVTGLSLLVSLSAAGMRDAPARLVLAHVLIVLPYVIRSTLASLLQLNRSLFEAAETLGATATQTFNQIILPLIRPGVVAGMIFGFILSFDDVNVSLFLVSARTVTLPISIMSYLQYSFDPSVAAISSTFMLLTFATTIVLERWFGLKRLFTGS